MKKILFGTLAALFLIVGFAAAQMPMGGPGSRGMGQRAGAQWMDNDDDDDMNFGPRMHCLAGLELSDKQEKQFMELQISHKKKMIETRSEMAGMMGKMKIYMTGDKFDAKAADALIDKKAEMQKKIGKERVQFMRTIRDMLTDDQKVVFDNNILSQGPGHGKKGQGMMGHGKKGMRMQKARCQ